AARDEGDHPAAAGDTPQHRSRAALRGRRSRSHAADASRRSHAPAALRAWAPRDGRPRASRVRPSRHERARARRGSAARLCRPLRGARAMGRRCGARRARPRRLLRELPRAGRAVSTHDHDHDDADAAFSLRTEALEALMTERGLVPPGAIEAIVRHYEQDVGPMNGARVVARAWADPAYRTRLLADATGAIAELGFSG